MVELVESRDARVVHRAAERPCQRHEQVVCGERVHEPPAVGDGLPEGPHGRRGMERVAVAVVEGTPELGADPPHERTVERGAVAPGRCAAWSPSPSPTSW